MEVVALEQVNIFIKERKVTRVAFLSSLKEQSQDPRVACKKALLVELSPRKYRCVRHGHP